MLFLIPLLLFWAGDYDTSLRAGLEALNRNDLPQAASQLEAASKLRPDSAAAWLGLAQTYRKLKRPADANIAIAKADQASAGTAAIILRGVAGFYAEGGEFGKAARALERFCDKAPKDADSAVGASVLYARAYSSASAIRMARRAVAIKDSGETRLMLARLYAGSNRTAECMTEWRRAARLLPYDEDTYFPIAQDLLGQQKFAEALEVLETGLKILERSAQLELARGVARYGLRRFPEAIDSFLRTIQLDPRVEQPYLFLGRMLDVAEAKLPAMLAAFRTYFEAHPDDPMATFEYARALAATGGDSAAVEKLLAHAIELKPDSWESHFELGLAYERRRAFEEAAKEMEKSILLNKEAAVPHYRLARVYDRLGRKAEADEQRAIHAKMTASTTKNP